ncbi:hypothetical protein PSCFBP3800_05090 [Pseudomonas syringae group genomosp. 3]|uniref:Uncharacterized protein n=1 Tax=Pseudomonas syringae group genomosp. 3 TaxID=251701 RepID=A0A2K4WKE4_9PSED|nr:hypothetical protein CFBP6411_05013 [Pseudomonas syringae group genomosp. 3]SPF20541.1 hypothetical protein PSCFBP3800_05090 [Pseudomonas syringae group genomosp. 3]
MTLCVTNLRHAPAFKIGRGASRTACDAERRTIVEIVVPDAQCSERHADASVGMIVTVMGVRGDCQALLDSCMRDSWRSSMDG